MKEKFEAIYDFIGWCMIAGMLGWISWILFHGEIWEVVLGVFTTIACSTFAFGAHEEFKNMMRVLRKK